MRYESTQLYCKTWPEWGSGNAPKLQVPCVSRSSQLRSTSILSYANYEKENPTRTLKGKNPENPT